MLGNRITRNLEGILFPFYFHSRLKQATPLIIYQMGKVGSASIYHTLKKEYPGVVLHVHSFCSNDEDWRIRVLYDYSLVQDRPLKIISLTREPIVRNISAFFQNFERDTGVRYQKSKFSMDEINYLFLNKYNHKIPLDWFDNNIYKNFGIDVYAKPFPGRGAATYHYKNFHLLVLRSEIEDSIKITAIKQFLDISEFKIKSKNISATKPYGETYRLFLESVVLPRNYVAEMCDSKYFNHFYSNEFVETTREKWTRGL